MKVVTVSSWLNFGRPGPLPPREGGLWLGKHFWLRLTTASAQCLHLSEHFFIGRVAVGRAVKGKAYHAPLRERRRVLIFLFQPIGGEPLMSVTHGQCDNNWHVASATTILRLPSQPPGSTAHWLSPNYTGWCQMHVCANNLPRVAWRPGFKP